MKQKRIILASSSPRRRELILWMEIPFDSIAADIDESLQKNEKPVALVQRLARQKAEKIYENHHPDGLILAADTIVVKGEHILGKPHDHAQAVAMLVELRDSVHQVITAVCFIEPDGKTRQDLCCSDVLMRDYSDREIQEYVNTGDPLDKAGGYAIQNGPFNPVREFKGCYASVMGFPFCHIERNLREIAGYNCLPMADICQRNLHYSCPIFARVLNGENIG